MLLQAVHLMVVFTGIVAGDVSIVALAVVTAVVVVVVVVSVGVVLPFIRK